jgi:transposase
MSKTNILQDLLGIQGWRIAQNGIRIEEDGAVSVRIEPEPGSGHFCGRCGEGVLFAYDHQPLRRIRDFPVWGRSCCLEVSLARVWCPKCRAVVVERLEWLESYARRTLRYERYVATLCGLMPVVDVAALEGLDKNAVYEIDRKWLERREALRPAHEVKRLGIDEIAIRKGHRYATVFYDLDRREVIALVASRRERAVSGFFRRWGKKRCRAVQAVCMDLWAAYLNAVRRHLKRAEIVFDKFHVYTYLCTAIEEVRRYEQGVAQGQMAKLLKGTRWLWLKTPGTLKRKQKYTLAEIMRLNRRLARAYILREDFEGFYQCESEEEASRFLSEWTTRCMRSRLDPFMRLAKRLRRWSAGILAYFRHRITNAVSEGINNKIKVLKRRAYGFHDLRYFTLKILEATGALPPLEWVRHPQT